jgi:hypothetical protein
MSTVHRQVRLVLYSVVIFSIFAAFWTRLFPPTQGLIFAQYQNETDELAFTQIQTVPDLKLSIPATLPLLPEHSYMRWSGWIRVPRTRSWLFKTVYDGELKIIIDRQNVFNGNTLPGLHRDNVVVFLKQGIHQIEILYRHGAGPPALRIEFPENWCSGGRCWSTAMYPAKPSTAQIEYERIGAIASYLALPSILFTQLSILLLMVLTDAVSMRRYRYVFGTVACSCLVLSVAFAGLQERHGGSIEKAIRIGKIYFDRFNSGDEAAKSNSMVTYPIGFDGQFFYYLAYDPFLTRPQTAKALDSPFLRAKRILYPLVARLIVIKKQWIPLGMFLTQILSLLSIVVLSALLLKEADLSPFWAFCISVSFPLLVSVETLTSETLATAFFFLTIWGYRNSRKTITWIGICLGILTKEPGLAILAAIVGSQILNRRWKDALFYGTAIIPFVLWYAFLRFQLGSWEEPASTSRNFTWPFVGVWHASYADMASISSDKLIKPLMNILSRSWLVVAAVSAFAFIFRRIEPSTIFSCLAGTVAILLGSGPQGGLCYDYLVNFGRQLYMLPPAIFWLFLDTRNRFLATMLTLLLVLSLWIQVVW